MKTRRPFQWAALMCLLTLSLIFWMAPVEHDSATGIWIVRIFAPVGALWLLWHLLRTHREPSLKETPTTAEGATELSVSTELPEFIELKRVSLGPHHLQPSGVGVTIHAGGVMEPMPPFAELRIVHYVGQESCYIFHFAKNGESTDTFHESLSDALRDAKDTYGVKETEWMDVNAPF